MYEYIMYVRVYCYYGGALFLLFLISSFTGSHCRYTEGGFRQRLLLKHLYDPY